MIPLVIALLGTRSRPSTAPKLIGAGRENTFQSVAWQSRETRSISAVTMLYWARARHFLVVSIVAFIGVPLMPTPNLPPGFDFTDPDVHADRLPVEELAELRRTAPIWWNEQPMGAGGFDDGGFWVVSKHKDVKEISLRSDIFSSLQKTALPRYKDGTVGEQIERGKFVLLNQDAPHHTRLRKIISRGFTPRAVERLRDDLAERARRIVAEGAGQGSGDFVEQVSCELPLQAIAGLLGVPQEDRMKLFHWSNQMVGDQDPEFATN